MKTATVALSSTALFTSLLLPQLSFAGELVVPRTAAIHVNDRGSESQGAQHPTVAMNSQGLVAVAWTDGNAHGSLDGWEFGIAAQLLDAGGTLLGANFVVNETTWREQVAPRLAVTANDDFVATWHSRSLGNNDASWSVGKGYLLSGPQELQVNVSTDDRQVQASVAASASGSEVVVWKSKHLDPYRWDIFARVDNGPELRVSGEADGDTHGRVAMDPQGNFAVVWERSGDLMMRTYVAGGTPTGAEFVANSSVAYTQRDPEIAALPGGGYLVVWEDDDTPNRRMQIMGRVFDAGGVAQGPRFVISDNTSSHAVDPAVATDPNGRAVVVWSQNPEIRGRLVDPASESLGAVFETGVMSSGQYTPAVAMGEADEFVVAWTAQAPTLEVYVRQYDIVDE